MLISLRWLNDYLSPAGVTADEAADILTSVGFPIESREEFSDHDGQPDVRLDVEITSNRGDCLSVVGLAREIAAKTGRKLVVPSAPAAAGDGPNVESALSLDNQVPDLCPLFTARVIRGVKVGPSPAWLVRHLEAVGQRSISNVVDVTNFINHELGNPCHVFDLAKLAGGALVVRMARDKERLRTLDGKERTLAARDVVVADAHNATSLAGVIGGGESEVGASTTDVVLEMATWDPVAVRTAARRLAIRTDASYRFERIVDARTIQAAADRAAALIVQLAGGKLCKGVLAKGAAPSPPRVIELRTKRCRAVLGDEIAEAGISQTLTAQGFAPRAIAGGFSCTVPAHRTDCRREIDLIEEVARTRGLDEVQILDKLAIQVKAPQEDQRAMREAGRVLTGLGFFETVTFSFVRPEHAAAWMPPGLETARVDDDRRGAEPALRPSVIPSLLLCRKANHDGQVEVEGGVRLYEVSRVFAQQRNPAGNVFTVENRNVGLLADAAVAGKKPAASDKQAGVRLIRGAVEHLAAALAAGDAPVGFEPAAPHCPALDPAGYARVTLGGSVLGYIGLVSRDHAAAMGLEGLYACAELNAGVLTGFYPPRSRVNALPTFPSIERDLSPIVPEAVTWDRVREVALGSKLPRLEGVRFVGTFRGKQIGAGKKSVTLRLRFRDAGKTLRHEEVDPEVKAIVSLLDAQCGATWRTA